MRFAGLGSGSFAAILSILKTLKTARQAQA
jgi:hypothetical protein